MNDRLSPESARLVVEALKRAGEDDLANTLDAMNAIVT